MGQRIDAQLTFSTYNAAPRTAVNGRPISSRGRPERSEETSGTRHHQHPELPTPCRDPARARLPDPRRERSVPIDLRVHRPAAAAQVLRGLTPEHRAVRSGGRGMSPARKPRDRRKHAGTAHPPHAAGRGIRERRDVAGEERGRRGRILHRADASLRCRFDHHRRNTHGRHLARLPGDVEPGRTGRTERSQRDASG